MHGHPHNAHYSERLVVCGARRTAKRGVALHMKPSNYQTINNGQLQLCLSFLGLFLTQSPLQVSIFPANPEWTFAALDIANGSPKFRSQSMLRALRRFGPKQAPPRS
jgi:hypothetical protein